MTTKKFILYDMRNFGFIFLAFFLSSMFWHYIFQYVAIQESPDETYVLEITRGDTSDITGFDVIRGSVLEIEDDGSEMTLLVNDINDRTVFYKVNLLINEDSIVRSLQTNFVDTVMTLSEYKSQVSDLPLKDWGVSTSYDLDKEGRFVVKKMSFWQVTPSFNRMTI